LILILIKLIHWLIISKFYIKSYCVNRDFIFTCLILFNTSQKTLREEEPVHPEYFGSAFLEPIINKLPPVLEFLDPQVQCLHTQESIATLSPVDRHLIIH